MDPKLSEHMNIGSVCSSPTSCSNLCSHTISLAPSVNALVVDKATVRCFLELQATPPPPRIATYPPIDRASALFVKSEFTKISDSSLLPFLKTTLALCVPLRYRRTYLTAIQCSVPWLVVYWLRCWIVNARLGQLPSAAYMMDPITLA